MHWNNLEWVVPKSFNVKKTPFLHLTTGFIWKKKNTNHWVGHLLREPIDVDKLFNRRVIISELETILNDYDAIDALGITKVQKETSVVAEVVQKEDIPVVEMCE